MVIIKAYHSFYVVIVIGMVLKMFYPHTLCVCDQEHGLGLSERYGSSRDTPCALGRIKSRGCARERGGGGGYQGKDGRVASLTELSFLLQSYCPPTRESFSDSNKLYYKPQRNTDVRWNWEKFLISKSGKPFMRYDPSTKPDAIRSDVMYLLQQEA